LGGATPGPSLGDPEPHETVLGEVAAALFRGGYACHCSSSAAAAVAFAKGHAPDLILCNINLAGHSGLELCERIKQDAPLANVPVMFLSGSQTPDIIRRSHPAGGTYYLRKPIDAEVLLELVDKVLWVPHFVGNRARLAATVGAG
jgi:CheY-like chemotaxis protein